MSRGAPEFYPSIRKEHQQLVCIRQLRRRCFRVRGCGGICLQFIVFQITVILKSLVVSAFRFRNSLCLRLCNTWSMWTSHKQQAEGNDIYIPRIYRNSLRPQSVKNILIAFADRTWTGLHRIEGPGRCQWSEICSSRSSRWPNGQPGSLSVANGEKTRDCLIKNTDGRRRNCRDRVIIVFR